jgi:hypothetical protein
MQTEHESELKLYKALPLYGELIYAMAILSDVSENANDDTREHLNDVKELIVRFIRQDGGVEIYGKEKSNEAKDLHAKKGKK